MAAEFASHLTAQCVDQEDDDIEVVEPNEDQQEDDGIYLYIVFTIAVKIYIFFFISKMENCIICCTVYSILLFLFTCRAL